MNRRQFLAAIPALYATACFGSEPEPEIVYVSSFGLGKYKSHRLVNWYAPPWSPLKGQITEQNVVIHYEEGFEGWSWWGGEPEPFPVWPETARELFEALRNQRKQKVLYARKRVDGQYVTVYVADF